MKRLYFIISILSALALSGCTISYEAYLRNLTNETALIDVFILDKKTMTQLPDRIKVAMEILPVKSGMMRKLEGRQSIIVKDTVHFIFEMKPHTTADLTDLAGRIWNGSWRSKVRVVVITGARADTIVNGWGRPDKKKFTLYEKGFSDPIYYYDIK